MNPGEKITEITNADGFSVLKATQSLNNKMFACCVLGGWSQTHAIHTEPKKTGRTADLQAGPARMSSVGTSDIMG